MKKFRGHNQTVIVTAYSPTMDEDKNIDINPPIRGRVTRLRHCDNGAFISLEERRPGISFAFPENDEYGRGTHVLVYPQFCHEVK